jgi:GDP-4-dehydro-6-deoxy-D-mannose reductase
MTTVVTGAGGFVGQHLTRYLNGRGEQVVALRRQDCDMLDAGSVREVLRKANPERIFHLAAQSLPELSWSDPAATFRVNVEGTLNLLEAVRLAKINPSIVIACSSSEYALSSDGHPIRETDSKEPLSPYGVSKLAADHCAHVYAVRYGLNILRVRPFFLIGPGKVGDVCSDLARRVVAVERGQATDVPVGRLDIVRDFLDIRDGIEAMVLIGEKGKAGQDYNVCAGHGHRIMEVLDGYRRLASRPVFERLDPSLLRPIDEPVKVGDPAKLMALGWTARHGLEESLSSILDYWRRRP